MSQCHKRNHIGSEIRIVVLYLVHNTVTQHHLVRLCHSLTYHRSFCRTEQLVVAKAFVDSLHKVGQENLFVVLEARCPKTGNSSPEQPKPAREKKKERGLMSTPLTAVTVQRVGSHDEGVKNKTQVGGLVVELWREREDRHVPIWSDSAAIIGRGDGG